MKHITLLIALLIASSAFGQQTERETNPLRNSSNVSYLVGGEHTSVVWNDIFGADRWLVGADSIRSRWIWIGYNQNATAADSQRTNQMLFETAPSVFNLIMRASPATTDDTCRIDRMHFKVARDTTIYGDHYGAMNPDSSSTFVQDGNANRADYGVWTFEEIVTTDTVAFIYPLKVLGGSWLQIWVRQTSSEDCTRVDADLEVPAGGR